MPVSTELSSRRFPHVELKMKGTQFPIMINNVTTCHKLQGCTKHAIFVNKFDYRSNWAYVVLSRVKRVEVCVENSCNLYDSRSRRYYGCLNRLFNRSVLSVKRINRDQLDPL
jgi:hypothetical protein